MSYEIVKKIRIQTTEDPSIGMRYDKVDMLCASNNVEPRTFEWGEFCTNRATLEEKIRGIFENAIDGNIKIQSTCGKFYQLYNTIAELNDKIYAFTKTNTLDFDFKYRANLYDEKKEWLANYATDLYFKREPRNFELFLEDFARKMEQTKEQKIEEFKRNDQISVHSASYASIFGKDANGQALYDVVADYDDNIYLCKREDYNNGGILSNASKAIRFPKDPLYGMLYGVLAGNYAEKTKAEVLGWYDNRPLHKASVDVQMDAVQDLLNGTELPAYDKLPWADFKADVTHTNQHQNTPEVMFGISESSHGAEHVWIFDEKGLKEAGFTDQFIEDIKQQETTVEDVSWPMGGSNSSATTFEVLNSMEGARSFLADRCDGPDSDDPMLVDIAEYYRKVEVDEGSITQTVLDRYGLTTEDCFKTDERVDKLLDNGYSWEYFYGEHKEMRYSEAMERIDQSNEQDLGH